MPVAHPPKLQIIGVLTTLAYEPKHAQTSLNQTNSYNEAATLLDPWSIHISSALTGSSCPETTGGPTHRTGHVHDLPQEQKNTCSHWATIFLLSHEARIISSLELVLQYNTGSPNSPCSYIPWHKAQVIQNRPIRWEAKLSLDPTGVHIYLRLMGELLVDKRIKLALYAPRCSNND